MINSIGTNGFNPMMIRSAIEHLPIDKSLLMSFGQKVGGSFSPDILRKKNPWFKNLEKHAQKSMDAHLHLIPKMTVGYFDGGHKVVEEQIILVEFINKDNKNHDAIEDWGRLHRLRRARPYAPFATGRDFPQGVKPSCIIETNGARSIGNERAFCLWFDSKNRDRFLSWQSHFGAYNNWYAFYR